MKSFCIIGLGNFGKNLALTLAQNGNQVLVIDNVESDIDAIADHVTNAVCGDPTNEMVLRAAGVASYGCCVVCLGSDNMQESILVTLTLKEYELLHALMASPGVVFTRDRLLSEIWGTDYDGETRTVDVHIRTLRQKLGDAGAAIGTVRGVGYRMEA